MTNIKPTLFVFALLIICSLKASAQNYERYKKLPDTTVNSALLGYQKNISITVPVEWQTDMANTFPLIIIFDRQNERSQNYMINTIDYLTSTEQMPSSIIITVASENRYRYKETLYKKSDENGMGAENERFIFEELIPLAEKKYKASSFRLLIGHSRYGYFTTSLFNSKINALNAVISMSPFFHQKNIDLTDSIARLALKSFSSKKYYRFGVGNDFPEGFAKMDSIVKKINNPALDIKGTHFKEADHSATPGLLIASALYEIFEYWINKQSQYLSENQDDLRIRHSIVEQLSTHYGSAINLSIGTLNGKGWHFYNAGQYNEAIAAWQILVEHYPNFSQAYLYIIKSKIKLKQDHVELQEEFKKSLRSSKIYTEEQKRKLEEELEVIKTDI